MHNVSILSQDYLKRLVDDLRVVDWILAAMRNHSTEPGVQFKACHLLGQLGETNEHVRHSVLHPEVMGAIDNARKNFRSSKDVQRAAKQALTTLRDP